ncbi:MAG: FtsX-like permease family protein [Pseudomonadota bacterium]
MSLVALAWKSARARSAATALTLCAIALSTSLVLAVEKVRAGARTGFEQTVSGADLLVGARSGPINLLLYSVFRLGDPTTNVSWATYEAFSSQPEVDWSIPLALGDSHGGFRVLGTTTTYFEQYRYGDKRPLAFARGGAFDGVYDAVLGAEAARELGYAIGDDFAISHGVRSATFAEHADHPFTVVGVLDRTGTPVDRTIHISLEGMDAVHDDVVAEAPPTGGGRSINKPDDASREHGDHDQDEAHGHKAHDAEAHDAEAHDHDAHDHENHDHQSDDHGSQEHEAHNHEAHNHEAHDHGLHEHEAHDHDPQAITAFLMGFKSKTSVLRFQRAVNTYDGEALTGVIPGAALAQLWRVLGPAEQALRGVSLIVVATGLSGLLTALLSTLNERRREIAVLRAVGAGRGDVFGLLLLEAAIVAGLGALLGAAAVNLVFAGFGPSLEAAIGAPLGRLGPSLYDAYVVAAVTLMGVLAGVAPGWIAYRRSLGDGLTAQI